MVRNKQRLSKSVSQELPLSKLTEKLKEKYGERANGKYTAEEMVSVIDDIKPNKRKRKQKMVLSNPPVTDLRTDRLESFPPDSSLERKSTVPTATADPPPLSVSEQYERQVQRLVAQTAEPDEPVVDGIVLVKRSRKRGANARDEPSL